MPTYEYVCTSCANAWEEVQKISEDALTVCPKCGQSTAKRQISGGNFILKGGGWYADLYSSTKKPSSGSGDSSGGGSSGGGSSGGESKPAAGGGESKPAAGGGGGGDSGGSSGGGSSTPKTGGGDSK